MNNPFVCRVFQGVMKLGNYFLGYHTPEVMSGAGCVRDLPRLVREKGVNNVLLVTDNTLLKLGVPSSLIGAMDDAGLSYTIFSDVWPNPTDENIESGLALYKQHGCQGIIAIGGGSPMDCAKGIAARLA